MKVSNHQFLKATYFILLILLVLPLIQQYFSVVKVDALSGAYEPKKEAKFSISNYLNEVYQPLKEDHFNENFGFRNYFVTINNQFQYSAFKNTKSTGTIIGENGFLFQENYIKAYYGTDFLGETKIKEQVLKIKKAQDLLKAKNIDLIIVFAPGKASFYPEYIPDSFHQTKKRNTNYSSFSKEFLENNINFIDFQSWFLQLKKTSKYPLFPKNGIHWSKYGELLAADSMIHYIGNKREIQMPQIKIERLEISNKMRDTDDDLEKNLNLIFNIEDLEMAYPLFDIKTDKNTFKPKVLTIADSFYWGMFNWGIGHRVFKDSQFWFYNNTAFYNFGTPAVEISKLDFKKEIEQNDAIILMATDANLPDFPFGFIDNLIKAYQL